MNTTPVSGLYYKQITIVNDGSSIVSKWSSNGASLTDNARVIIYDHNMFIIQATSALKAKNIYSVAPYIRDF